MKTKIILLLLLNTLFCTAQSTVFHTSSTSNTDHGKWTKVASVTLNSLYSNSNSTILLSGGNSSSNVTSSKLFFRVKQQAAFPGAPYVQLELIQTNNSRLGQNDIKAVATTLDASQSIVDLYIRITNTWERIALTPILINNELPTFYSNQGFVNSLPTGIQTNCEQPSGFTEIYTGASNTAEGLVLSQGEIGSSNVYSSRLFFENRGEPENGFSILKSGNQLSFRTGATPGVSSGSHKMGLTKDGNVGIGIGGGEPLGRLNVIPAGSMSKVADFNNTGIVIGTESHGIGIDGNEISHKGNNLYITSHGQNDTTGNIRFGTTSVINEVATDHMIITNDGKIGVGIMNPKSNFEIYTGDLNEAKGLVLSQGSDSANRHSGRLFFENKGEPTNGFSILKSGDYLSFRTGANPNITSGSAKMRIMTDGRVVIGEKGPTTNAKLTVAGNIHAQEIKVTIDAGADFVFEEDYKLPSLLKLKKYLKQNNHLPEIASAKEMETNGIHLAEMNIKLLQKIEELTLYTIQQEVKIEKEAKKNKELEVRLQKIEKLLLK